jgi:hypothetical protein
MPVASVPVVADADEFFKPFRTVLSKPQYAHFYRLVFSLMVCLQAHRVARTGHEQGDHEQGDTRTGGHTNRGTGYVFLLFRPAFRRFRQRPSSLSSFSMKCVAPLGRPV